MFRTALPFFSLLVLGFSVCLCAAEPDLANYPRSQGEIKAMIQMLAPKKGTGASVENEYMQRLKQHRYIVGVPYEELTWDETDANLAKHAAIVDAKLNKLTHNPEHPPGMSDADYELGKEGAGQSNLFEGLTVPTRCVDEWMDDSDKSNIDRVGHRRWCINPSMLKTGFGASGNFAAMFAFDKSNKNVPDCDFVTYPARGYMPIQFFGSKYAWSVSPNMSKFEVPVQADISVAIQAVDSELKPVTGSAPLKLDYYHVDTGGFGSGPAIIFRPDSFKFDHDSIFRVDITGLKLKNGGAAPLSYIVHFVNLQKIPDSPETTAVYTRYFKPRFAAAQALADRVDQWQALNELYDDEGLKLTEPAFVATVTKALTELNKEPTLRREQEALTRYKSISDADKKTPKKKDKKDDTARVQIALAYRGLAENYKETRAGKKAAEEFERWKKEIQ